MSDFGPKTFFRRRSVAPIKQQTAVISLSSIQFNGVFIRHEVEIRLFSLFVTYKFPEWFERVSKSSVFDLLRYLDDSGSVTHLIGIFHFYFNHRVSIQIEKIIGNSSECLGAMRTTASCKISKRSTSNRRQSTGVDSRAGVDHARSRSHSTNFSLYPYPICLPASQNMSEVGSLNVMCCCYIILKIN